MGLFHALLVIQPLCEFYMINTPFYVYVYTLGEPAHAPESTIRRAAGRNLPYDNGDDDDDDDDRKPNPPKQ